LKAVTILFTICQGPTTKTFSFLFSQEEKKKKIKKILHVIFTGKKNYFFVSPLDVYKDIFFEPFKKFK